MENREFQNMLMSLIGSQSRTQTELLLNRMRKLETEIKTAKNLQDMLEITELLSKYNPPIQTQDVLRCYFCDETIVQLKDDPLRVYGKVYQCPKCERKFW